MIDTTEQYKTAIQASRRNIKPRVAIYFDGDYSDPIILASDDIAGIDFLEESQAEGENPLGAVSSNEVTLTLRNAEGQFCPNNSEGPYYGKLLPHVKVLPYYGVEIEGGSFEWIPLGVFRTGDWDAPSGEPYATTICNDILFEIGEKDVPLIPTMQNISQYTAFETLFKAIGLASDDYEIDAVLTTEVPIVYYPNGKVRNALAIMAVAFNCTVSVKRDGKVKVLSNSTVGSSVVTMTDTNMVYTSNMPQKFANVYSEVNVRSSHHTVKSTQSVLGVEGADVPASGREMDKLSFAASAFVEYIKITRATHLAIGSISIGSQGMSLHLSNEALAQKSVDVEVFGHPMGIASDEVEVRDTDMYDKIGSKKLYVDKHLIQEKPEALVYANKLKVLVRDPSAYVYCKTRGDPSIECPGDTITVVDDTNKLGSIEIIPLRMDYRYDGGLGCDILGIKKSAREAA